MHERPRTPHQAVPRTRPRDARSPAADQRVPRHALRALPLRPRGGVRAAEAGHAARDTPRAEGQARHAGSRSPSASTRRCARSDRSRSGSPPSANRESRPSSRRSIRCCPSTRPLVDLVAARMPEDPDPLRDVVFILRTGALFPVYRTFSLLEQLKGRVHVPDRALLPRRPRRSGRPALHGRARRRAQLPPEDLLTRNLMTTHADQDALRQRHPPSHRRGHQGRPDRRGDPSRRDRRVRRHRRDSVALHRHLRGVSRDAEQAARRHRDLGLGLLRLRQVELREDARPLDREPRRSQASRLPSASPSAPATRSSRCS